MAAIFRTKTNSSTETSASRLSLEANSAISEEEHQDTILMDPAHASLLQKKWLTKLTEGKPPEIVGLFNRILKHLNGRHALERYLPHEGLTRQDLRRLLKAFPDDIIVTRHW
jgi:hypothetical protein